VGKLLRRRRIRVMCACRLFVHDPVQVRASKWAMSGFFMKAGAALCAKGELTSTRIVRR
jgi:hypothetical protein